MQEYQLEIAIANKNDLLSAYLPFVKNSGIFIRTTDNFQIGEVVTVKLQLWCLTEPAVFTGKVVWITPAHAQGGRPAGVGVQFVQEGGKHLKDVIEKQLAGLLQAEQRTDTI